MLSDTLLRIDQLKAQIDMLRPFPPEREAPVMQKLHLEWNYHSNALEGNRLTLGQTRAFLLHGTTAQGKPLRDYLDLRGHNEALGCLKQLVHQEEPLTEAHIRALHEVLLGEPRRIDAVTESGLPTKKWIVPGKYKTTPNHVRTSTDEIYYYASPEDTPARMRELINWYRKELAEQTRHPLILAATFHYYFVQIHPFDDGNGRMARLLMNLSLMQHGYVPAVVRVESKDNYLLALE